MVKSKKADAARVRAVIQREMAAGHSFDEAKAKAAAEEAAAYKRMVSSK